MAKRLIWLRGGQAVAEKRYAKNDFPLSSKCIRCLGVVPMRANNAGNSTGGGLNMIKSELIEKLAAENLHLTHAEVERVVNVILGRMTDALSDGGRVELRGFGAFSVRSRPARSGRNPRTGETVEVPAKAVPFFKSGKELRLRLNASGDA